MTEHSLWRFSRALHRAVNDRDFSDIESLIDEDVEWAIYGPIDMFPFLGARQGRDAVLDVIGQLADNFRVRRFDRESIMLGVDSAASMLRYSLTALDSDKPISLRVAQFAQFRAGKLISMRVLFPPPGHALPGRAGRHRRFPVQTSHADASGSGPRAPQVRTGIRGRGCESRRQIEQLRRVRPRP